MVALETNRTVEVGDLSYHNISSLLLVMLLLLLLSLDRVASETNRTVKVSGDDHLS